MPRFDETAAPRGLLLLLLLLLLLPEAPEEVAAAVASITTRGAKMAVTLEPVDSPWLVMSNIAPQKLALFAAAISYRPNSVTLEEADDEEVEILAENELLPRPPALPAPVEGVKMRR